MALPEVGVEAVVKGFGTFQSQIGKMGQSVVGFGKTAAKVAIAGVAALGAAAVGVGAASLKAAVEFEDAWTGVLKTTDGLVDSTGQLTRSGEELQQGFRDLAKEVPISVEELMHIGELGGQLGIAKEDLVDFTNTVAAIGVTTNLTTEEAATEFARMANIMGTPQEEISNMASSVVALGNNFATTERDVLNFASRIAGAGHIAGLTEAQVFGIGAAMSSVGIEAEAGGTAVQKVLLGMNEAVTLGGDQLEIFAAVAGETTEDFADMWEKDAGKSFDAFVKGLGRAGDDAIVILDELGLKDQRLIRSFLSLAGAGDLLTESLEMSTEAFEDNTALQREADLRYQTTSAQMQLLKNNLKDVAITIGQWLLPLLNKMVEAAKPVIDIIAGIVQGLIHFVQYGELMHPSEFIPGFFELPEAVQGIVEKVLQFGGKLVAWLQVEIPKAAKQASQFWNDTLYPALQAMWGFIQDPLIPIISKVVGWLQENIPAAFKAVKAFWDDPLKPTLIGIYEYIRDNVIPKVIEIAGWLQTNIPAAFRAVRAFWDTHLHPALIGIWAYLSENVIPIVSEVFNWLSDNIPRAFRIVKAFWERTLWPALKDMWHYFQDNIIPILTDVFYFLTDVGEGVVGGFQILQKWWYEHGEELISLIAGGIGQIVEALRDVVEWVKKAIDWLEKFNDVKLPMQLPNLQDIGKPWIPGQQTGGWWKRSGVARLHPNEMVLPLTNQAGINALSRAMRQAMLPLMAPMAVAGGGTQNVVNLNMNNTITDAMDVAVLEARIERVITNAVGR